VVRAVNGKSPIMTYDGNKLDGSGAKKVYKAWHAYLD